MLSGGAAMVAMPNSGLPFAMKREVGARGHSHRPILLF
jgi:hypothetical protein